MQPIPDDAVLIIIDMQQGFDGPAWGNRNNPQAEENAARLLTTWRDAGRPIIHVRHDSVVPGSPLRPGQPGNNIKALVAPQSDEPVISKNVNSAFIGTDLEERLRKAGLNTLVIAGLTTDHCVSTTVRMAGNLGFETYVVSDATATHDREGYDGTKHPAEDIHRTALASLHGEFATVVDTDSLLGNPS